MNVPHFFQNVRRAVVTLVQTRRMSTLLIGLLGALKLITNALGWHVITNTQINTLTNSLASILTVMTVVMTHNKPTPKLSPTTNSPPNQNNPVASLPERNSSDPSHAPEAASDGYARPPADT